jgi:hypothetical protein
MKYMIIFLMIFTGTAGCGVKIDKSCPLVIPEKIEQLEFLGKNKAGDLIYKLNPKLELTFGSCHRYLIKLNKNVYHLSTDNNTPQTNVGYMQSTRISLRKYYDKWSISTLEWNANLRRKIAEARLGEEDPVYKIIFFENDACCFESYAEWVKYKKNKNEGL